MSAIWATGTNTTATGGAATVLYTGEFVEAPAAYDSPSGQFRLQFQVEGNLVLLQMPAETVLWASGSEGLGGDTLIMQEDGNLVIYAGGIFGTPIWASGTGDEANADAYLVLQNDGNLVVYTPLGLQPLGVFTIPPDWAEGSMEHLEWLTSVTESPQAVEQRMGLRISPRVMFEYTYVVFNRRRTHFDMLNMAAAGSPFYLPVWHDKATLTSLSSAGATVLSLDTQYTDFQNCPVAVLMTNEYDYELVEIQSFTDSSLTLTLGLSRLWPAGSVIYPCKKVRVETQLSGERHADRAFKGRMRFQSLEKNDSNSEIVLNTYLDNLVLEDEPNEAGGVGYQYNRKEYLLDTKLGLQLLSDVAPFVNQNHSWFAKGRQKAWRLRGLLYALQGKRRPIWVPSFFSDFELAADAADDAVTLTVRRCGYSDTGGPFTHRDHIVIHLRGGTRLYRKIVDAAIVGDEGLYEEIGLSEPTGVAFTPDEVLRISFITLCRLDQDMIELVHHTDSTGLTTANLVWRTDPGIGGTYSETVYEVPPLSPTDPLLPVIYDPFKSPSGKLWQYAPSFATSSGSDYVGIWWASRRTAAELLADDPFLPANVDDAFPGPAISGSGAYVDLPLTGSFILRVGLYFDNMGWVNPEQIFLNIQFLNSSWPDIELLFASGIPGAPGDVGLVNPVIRYVYTLPRREIAASLDDPEVPMQVHLEWKFTGGVNAQPICNPTGDCSPYHGDETFANGGDSYWILEWYP